MNRLAILLVACCIIITDAVGAPAAAAPASAPAKGGELYQQVTRAYMMCDWPELDRSLKAAEAAKAALTAEQQADVKYVREALAECRPAWWSACKTTKTKITIRPSIWNKEFAVTYDPAGKPGSLSVAMGRSSASVTVAWASGEVDSPAEGLYGYPLGAIATADIWSRLARSQIWTAMSPKEFDDPTRGEKLERYMAVREHLAALYYGPPASRRYLLHIFAATYYDKWGKGDQAAGRRAVCAGILQEIVKNPSKFPTLKLPEKLEGDRAETAIGREIKKSVRYNIRWTIGEDRAVRLAVKAMATNPANQGPMLASQSLTLSDGLSCGLQEAADEKSFRPKRDAWFAEAFAKSKK